MAARATSSATISFGLVAIPVKVFTAAQSKAVRFSMLHETDKARLKQQYVCSTCDEIVARTETVKGYEYARGQYVVMTDEELKALERRSDKTIAIEEFIPIEQVDPIYFEKSNLLGPDKGGQKSYRLLRQAMQEAGKVALGRFATRGRQQLVLLRPTDRGLVLHGLHHADEVRSFDDIELGDAVDFKKGELALANQLIDQLSSDRFEPTRYEDEYRQAVLQAVDRKVAGEEVVLVPDLDEREQVIDLVAALKQSLAGKSAAKPAGKAAPRAQRVRKPAQAKGKKKAAKKKVTKKKTASR